MISRWEAGHHEPSALYRQLFDAVYEAGVTTGGHTAAALRSHQFIVVWLGGVSAQELAVAHGMTLDTAPWTEPYRCRSASPTSECACNLHVWPHGVAICHVVDECSFSSLAALAIWRQHAYGERLRWATAQLQPIAPNARASYILSLYWLTASAWSGDDYETAMRIMRMPPVLLSRDDDDDGKSDAGHGDDRAHQHAEARLTENTLLATKWDHPDIRSFGVAGTSSGYASWSGVVYHAQSASRALSEEELVDLELAIQSAWAYCAHLNGELEQGRDPLVPDQWGWRYLRAVRSRLINPRPRESGQHRSMREAILETSVLVDQLDQAIEALRHTAMMQS
jgi:hypothetical protein